ncbi:MAG: hypothetical protein SFV18_01945 [Bryobacteraceae bacterium]|nr:hypothetical protein [Bryobacteraceae bacterium]
MTNRECPIAQNRPDVLIDYVARRLDLGRLREVEDHAAGCEPCREFVAEQAAAWSALDSYSAPPVSIDFDRALYRRIESENRDPWWKRFGRRIFFAGEPGVWRPAMAATAACTLLFAIALTVPKRVPAIVEKAEAPAVETAEVESVEQALEDLEMLRVAGNPAI